MSIKIENICKNYQQFQALYNINLELQEGKLTALLGPSGSGKTTLLRIIAGLEQADSGYVHFFGKNITKEQAKDRGVGFVFQHYALFKHMNVFENIAFGLKVRPKKTRPSKERIKQKVMELLQMVQLESMSHRYPNELSGGQKQRVALARALAVEPKVLLLDEPFGALDAKVRQDLRRWLRKLHDEIHLTSIFVTHDQEEALEVSDEIVIMNQGAVEQIGSPEEVYESPANHFVYSFLGNVNIFSGRVTENKITLDTNAQETLFVRPHEIEVLLEERENAQKARIISHRILGARVRIDVELVQSDHKQNVEADIPKSQFNLIKEKNPEFVYLYFSSLRCLSGDNKKWSDYVI